MKFDLKVWSELRFMMLTVLLSILAILPANGTTADDREWNFKVFLDDSEIGYHRFSLSGDATQLQLTSEADFRVKFLFVTAYRYRHSNRETWQGECLQQIESQTKTNGTEVSVIGTRGPNGFEINGSDPATSVTGCIKTFAYWNPDILSEDELLNAQTGELLTVEVEALQEESLIVHGEPVLAQKYRLSAKGMDLLLWYSEDREWLGLQSTTEGGRKLRYVLS